MRLRTALVAAAFLPLLSIPQVQAAPLYHGTACANYWHGNSAEQFCAATVISQARVRADGWDNAQIAGQGCRDWYGRYVSLWKNGTRVEIGNFYDYLGNCDGLFGLETPYLNSCPPTTYQAKLSFQILWQDGSLGSEQTLWSNVASLAC